MGILDDLAVARAAFERHEWTTAYSALEAPDPDQLDTDDLERLGTAAFLVAQTDASCQALQRAHHRHLDSGDDLAAVRCAFWLGLVLLTHGDAAVGAGWVAQAERLLAQQDDDVVERGYVLINVMFGHVFRGEFPDAMEAAARITDYGRRFDDLQLVAMGLSSEGRLMMYGGRVREGLALFDEAMVFLAAGEVSPALSGHIYCSMIEACQEVADLTRAAAWTAALTRWCDNQPGLVPFTGQCAVHRGQIMSAHGAFGDALEEFGHARERYQLEGAGAAVGLAWAEEGDVRRVLGDLAGAEAAYERATEHGHEPQPGLALLWLARGRTTAAVAAVHRLLAETGDPVHRSRILPTAVDVLLAGDEVADAASLAEEMTGLAQSFGSPAVAARAAYAEAAVSLARGDAGGALPYLRRATAQWTTLEAPYETARCRLAVGRALRGLGDEASARAELEQARRAFAELGAAPAEREAAGLLTPSLPGGLTEREVEVIRLVAGGRSNPEIAAALVLSEKTVARHLSNIFTKLDVSSRTAAAAYAYEHQLV